MKTKTWLASLACITCLAVDQATNWDSLDNRTIGSDGPNSSQQPKGEIHLEFET